MSPASIDLSFEVFPASSEVAKANLKRTVQTLARFSPRFLSVTQGADGASQDQTLQTLDELRIGNPNLGLAGHLTSRTGSKGETLAVAEDYEAAGSRWIVALRGDSSNGAGQPFQPHPHGFQSTPEFIEALKQRTKMRIAVAGYPEKHPDSPDEIGDIDHLKRKVDAGADVIITQFFFDNDDFYRFIDRCRLAGINCPIIPGIMPIHKFASVAKFSARCGAKIPKRIADRFAKADERGASYELALATCAGQCDQLRDQGVRAFHFFTMNRSDLTVGVCQALGLDPSTPVDGDRAPVERAPIPQAVSAH